MPAFDTPVAHYLGALDTIFITMTGLFLPMSALLVCRR